MIKSLDTVKATGPDIVSLTNLLRYQPMLLSVIYLVSLSVTYLKTNVSSLLKQLQWDQFFKKLIGQKLKTTDL